LPTFPRAESAAARWGSLVRFGSIGLAVVLAIFVLAELATVWSQASAAAIPTVGYDFAIYVDRTQSWLAGAGFYRARQLAEPCSIEGGDALYPPPTVLLFLPWALGAPMFLWWAIPVVIAAVALVRLRPPMWASFLLLAVLIGYPRSMVAIVLGNPSM